ncbi:MAG: ribosome maturation factor RimM [Clostridia bacterium]
MLTVAQVLKPQGLRGEIKILALTDQAENLYGIKAIYIEDKEYAVEKIKADGVFAYIKLSGIDDRDSAEALRNKMITVARDSLPPLEEGRYYIADLIGLEVYIEDNFAGKLTNILQHGSADIYCVAGDRNFMFPAVGAVIKLTDIANGRIVLDAKILEEMAVYED